MPPANNLPEKARQHSLWLPKEIKLDYTDWLFSDKFSTEHQPIVIARSTHPAGS
jgi:hypothetical protein